MAGGVVENQFSIKLRRSDNKHGFCIYLDKARMDGYNFGGNTYFILNTLFITVLLYNNCGATKQKVINPLKVVLRNL